MSPRWRFAVILGLVIASGVLVAVGCSGPSGDDEASASKAGGGGSPDGKWAQLAAELIGETRERGDAAIVEHMQ